MGAATAELALQEALAPDANRHGGEIVIKDSQGSLVSEFDEKVVAIATQMNNGTWLVLTISGCANTRWRSEKMRLHHPAGIAITSN